ncbi:Predicted dehydrogenase [Chitinophaga sp. CF118]|uniref:Gfo/Idh/MocA family protein n=1 Tax=Chitinophaga sp. CF118 TaxID=1884367 RepID=UPI0008EA9E1E|nr:Gfo/Idh/MocA family oxidoreductase [Chitinophaga sp. CF118]SFD61508.1 Predicted dehydrogenase [Chitinophaga sp. CF118]
MHLSSRRHFLKNAAILAPVLSLMPSYLSAGTGSRLRIAFIGVGPWGLQYLTHALQHRDLDVRAICDNDPVAVRKGLELFSNAGYSRPDVYTDTYKTLLDRKDIDAVLIAAPWHQHYEIAKAAMLADKHVACGTIMGTTLAEHWDIVRTSEQTGCQYFTLDEHNYRSDLIVAANMVKQGVFGNVEAVRAGANHYQLNGQRTPYPVYPATVVARITGNAFVSLRTTKEKQQYVVNRPHPKTGDARLFFTSGTLETITLTTATGQTVQLQSGAGDLSTGFHVKGSEGSWMDVSKSIYKKDAVNHVWEADKPYLQEYTIAVRNERFKHSPENDNVALALQDFINGIQQSTRSVYAAATNSVIGPLAVLSAKRGGAVVSFPDFSNGKA